MPKSKTKSKREASSSDSDSGPEDRGPAKKKPAPSKPAESKSGKGDEEPSWSLGNKKFVKVSEFKGTVYVSIREYYEKNGEMLPTKKGITLNAANYRELKSVLSEVDEALAKF
ncbi:hypothetical protein FOCC_FOCC001240 [Frankliniella occidentalis]|uniref:Activated RNA polymerase II transcriptional coactivator p15 n=1 Tax=Frankliniella occidentalis TaxID=133901 RepID=A0A6J1SC49_FRAOC|nr:activated RNA polymerase II transcriptional coactivator p15 [Frankliniella occidentalis]KAE8752078.1 hypothetical protein FOCC_FOCC001240 [Frankliniella occidentalis]